MSSQPNRRRFFRIRYPLRERPTLIVNAAAFRIVEISEGGARIRHVCPPPAILRRPYPVRIVFFDGSESAVDAVVTRVQGSEFVLRFVRRIPLKFIISEQRHLLQRYPRVVLAG